MPDRTTFSIHKVRRKKIEAIAEELGLAPQKIVKFCLKKKIHKIKKGSFAGNLMKYQPRLKKYLPFHITFSPTEYDRNLDLKKIYRFSLSLLIAEAIDEYADSFTLKEINSYPKIQTNKSYFRTNSSHLFLFALEIEEQESERQRE